MKQVMKGSLGAIVLAVAWAAVYFASLEYLRVGITVALALAWFAAMFAARLLRMGVWSAAIGFCGFMLLVSLVYWAGGSWHLGGRNMAPGVTTAALVDSALRAAFFVSPALVEMAARLAQERGLAGKLA